MYSSKYTITLGELVQAGYEVALNDYPIFDESYRDTLNQNIINRYWFQEIGAETPDRWNFLLKRKMDLIMQRYNQYYLAEQEKFDPFITTLMQEEEDRDEDRSESESDTTGRIMSDTTVTDETSTGTETTEGTEANTRDTSESGTSQDLKTRAGSVITEMSPVGTGYENQYDMPQDQATNYSSYLTARTESVTQGETREESVSDDYKDQTDRTDERSGTDSFNGTTSSDRSSSDKFDSSVTRNLTDNSTKATTRTKDLHHKLIKKVFGRNGYNPSDLIEAYRRSIISVDELIIAELSTLFMGIR